jgi:hypothetical protein
VLLTRPGFKTGTTSGKRFRLSVLAIATIVLSLSSVCGATPAGTILSNQATLQSSTGSITSNIIRLTVAQIGGGTLSPVSASLFGAPGSLVSFPVILSNTGNGSDSFTISASSNAGWVVSLYRDTNNDGIRQSTETTTVNSSGNLAAGATFKFFATATVPSSTTQGAQSSIAVVARSAFNSAVAPSVTYTASAQTLQTTQGFSLSPEASTKNSNPDTTVFFPVTLTNTGSTSASFSLSVRSGQGWSVALYKDTNGDGIRQSGESTLVSDTGVVTSSGQFKFFAATAIPRTTSLGSQGTMTVTAQSVTNTTSTKSITYIAIAGQIVGSSISPTSALVNAPSGQKVYIPFTLTNIGGSQDSFALAVTSNLAWVCRVIADSNQDGIHQSTEITSISSIGSLATSTGKKAFVEVSIPSGLTTQIQSTITVKATSSLNTTKVTQVAYTVAASLLQMAGDINSDNIVTATDAYNIAQIAVGQGNWTIAQKAAADVNRDGVVDIRDVMQILNSTRTLPFTAVAPSQGGRKVSGSVVSASPNATVGLDLQLDTGSAVAAFQGQLTYDSTMLKFFDITPGSLMGSSPNWNIITNIEQGRLRIIAYNTAGTSLATGPGSIVQLQTLVSQYAQINTNTLVGWDSAILTDASGAIFAPMSYSDGSVKVTSGN